MTNVRTVFWNMCGAKHVVRALAETLFDVNNDFNGVNGKDFTSREALDAGFESDLEYVSDLIVSSDVGCRKSVEFVVQSFLSELFKDTDWYASWNYEILEHPNWGTIGVAVAWTLGK